MIEKNWSLMKDQLHIKKFNIYKVKTVFALTKLAFVYYVVNRTYNVLYKDLYCLFIKEHSNPF